MIPSYEDVRAEDERHWLTREIFKMISQGYSDHQIHNRVFASPQAVGKRRKYYLGSMVKQVSNIVLKDGRVIPLTKKQAQKVNLILIMSTRMDKKILIKGYEPAFKLSDIEIDPKEILRLTQIEFDLGKIDQLPKPGRLRDMG